jgi:hypothetical protein
MIRRPPNGRPMRRRLPLSPLAIMILLFLAALAAMHRLDPPQPMPLIHADYERCLMIAPGPIEPPEAPADEEAEHGPQPPAGADLADYQRCAMIRLVPLLRSRRSIRDFRSDEPPPNDGGIA